MLQALALTLAELSEARQVVPGGGTAADVEAAAVSRGGDVAAAA